MFWKPLAYVYVIEFQKRGLSHCHILIILNNNSKPLSSDDYDKFVSAEISDASELPILYSLVTSHMIHGPCGEANKNYPCMQNNECSKRFPKQFCERTFQSTDGYRGKEWCYPRQQIDCSLEIYSFYLNIHHILTLKFVPAFLLFNIFINIFIKE